MCKPRTVDRLAPQQCWRKLLSQQSHAQVPRKWSRRHIAEVDMLHQREVTISAHLLPACVLWCQIAG